MTINLGPVNRGDPLRPQGLQGLSDGADYTPKKS